MQSIALLGPLVKVRLTLTALTSETACAIIVRPTNQHNESGVLADVN